MESEAGEPWRTRTRLWAEWGRKMRGGSRAYARRCPGRTKACVTCFYLLISAWHGHLDVRDRCSPTTDRRGVLVSHVNCSFLDIVNWILWAWSDRGVEFTTWKIVSSLQVFIIHLYFCSYFCVVRSVLCWKHCCIATVLRDWLCEDATFEDTVWLYILSV